MHTDLQPSPPKPKKAHHLKTTLVQKRSTAANDNPTPSTELNAAGNKGMYKHATPVFQRNYTSVPVNWAAGRRFVDWFLTSFRPYTNRNCPRHQVATWVRSLTGRIIYIPKQRDRTRWSAVVELLYRSNHIPNHEVHYHRKEQESEAYLNENIPRTTHQRTRQVSKPPKTPRKEKNSPEHTPFTQKNLMGISSGGPDTGNDPTSSS